MRCLVAIGFLLWIGCSGGNAIPQPVAAGAGAQRAAGVAGGASAGSGPAGADGAGSPAAGSAGSAIAGSAGSAIAGSTGSIAGSGGSIAGSGGSIAGSGGSAAGSGTAGMLAGSADTDPASCTRSGAATDDTPVVYVVGDSTASVYTTDLYPRMGWAQPLPDYFTPACAQVRDKALSGRSSKSFYEEGAWTPIRNALRAGDFVLIQFGHNDEKSDDPERYTEPFTTYTQYLTRYIDEAQAKGASVILLTSIERNKWSQGKLSATHGDYPEAVRRLAQARKLTLVDMTALTHAHFERLGQTATSALFMNLAPGESPNYPSGNTDDTHLQEKGARVVADIAMAELARQRVPLAASLRRVPMP
jgi:pectinesterase